MALDPYNENGLPDGSIQANDLFFAHGAEAVHFKPVFISTSDIDSWTALADGAYFIDENGTGQKRGSDRYYFGTQEWVNQQIAAAITNADARHYFDPTSSTNPSAPSGSIKSGDVFVITKDGTWSGMDLKAGDILEAPADVTGTPVASNFLLNQAVSGLESVPDATTLVKGIIQLVDNIRVDGSADDTTAATEKAVADALSVLNNSIAASVEAIRADLQGKINTNTGSITALNGQIIDLQDADADASSRLDDLEEWSEKSVVINLGGGKDLSIGVTGVEFKDIENVQMITEVNTRGSFIRTNVIVPLFIKVTDGGTFLNARFKSAIPPNAYRVRIVGLGKVAA